MTRLLFFADAHIGAGDRFDDQAAVLDRIVDVAAQHRVDAVLFGGDATHHRSAVREVAVFQGFLHSLGRLGIPFVAIPGNHDRSTMDVPSTLEVAARGFANTRVADRPCVLAEIEGVAICALPWAPTSAIAAMDQTGQVDGVARTAVEILMATARGLRYETLGKPAILMGHWSLAGSVTPTGALVDEFREPVLPTRELAEIGFDACLFGHIHTAGLLAESPPCGVLYAGSPCVCDFGEADTDHGVWIVEMGDGLPTCEFVPIADRRFVTLTIDPDTAMFLPDVTDAIVRVRYTATPEQERMVDHAAIREQILALGAARVTTIEPTILGRESTRTAVTDELSIDDAFGLWLDDQDDVDRDAVLAIHHEIREAVR